ncbi:MAG: excinuclease ABC subunit UvrC [Opitutaceae bacterium]
MPTIKEKVRHLPQGPGVYLMKDRLGSIIYVGKAKNLRKRVSSYFQPSRGMIQQPKIRALVDMIHDLEVIEVKSEPEALLLEGRLIKQYRPKYNTDFTDDKRFLLLRLDTSVPIPRFTLVRYRKDDNARYFGPFPHSGHLRRTLTELRRQFGIILADTQPREVAPGRYRLYDDVRAELYGHPNEVTIAEFKDRLDAACHFLEGHSRAMLGELKQQMEGAAREQDYEKAAALRDVYFALEKTLSKTRKFARNPVPAPIEEHALEELQRVLALPSPARHLECFDISHISGTFVVASMVHFTEGRPDKAQYRRYKIRSFIGNDDFRAMEEVVGRRYRRLAEEGRPFPDLVVIDGGKGQVAAALKAFLILDLEPPPLIGLAKKKETVIFSDGRDPLNLPLNHPALQLLQRLRDEAHRFANTFNADLRTKRIRESILDSFSGLGPVRRQALIDHFGSIERLKAASEADLKAVEGIGPKTAAELRTFLDANQSDRATPAPQ